MLLCHDGNLALSFCATESEVQSHKTTRCLENVSYDTEMKRQVIGWKQRSIEIKNAVEL